MLQTFRIKLLWIILNIILFVLAGDYSD